MRAPKVASRKDRGWEAHAEQKRSPRVKYEAKIHDPERVRAHDIEQRPAAQADGQHRDDKRPRHSVRPGHLNQMS